MNYNTADLTKKLVESIFNKASGFDEKTMEVIVLDNGELDPCENLLSEYSGKIKYIKSKENQGFTKGYNKTIKYSLGEYYLMLNSDIEVTENSLTEILKSAEDFKGQAVVSGKLVFPSGDFSKTGFSKRSCSGLRFSSANDNWCLKGVFSKAERSLFYVCSHW